MFSSNDDELDFIVNRFNRYTATMTESFLLFFFLSNTRGDRSRDNIPGKKRGGRRGRGGKEKKNVNGGWKPLNRCQWPFHCLSSSVRCRLSSRPIPHRFYSSLWRRRIVFSKEPSISPRERLRGHVIYRNSPSIVIRILNFCRFEHFRFFTFDLRSLEIAEIDEKYFENVKLRPIDTFSLSLILTKK